jgi:hypothetical protein
MKLTEIEVAELPVMRLFHAHNTNTCSSELNKKLVLLKLKACRNLHRMAQKSLDPRGNISNIEC